MADKDTFFSKKQFLNINGTLVDFSEPCVMGILNATPDSFYSQSRFIGEKEVIQRAQQIIDEGGRIIDVGAYSSRPGAENIDAVTEKARLKPVLEVITQEFPNAIISLDTFRADIAQWAVEHFGVAIINDISGGMADKLMFSTIASIRVPYVLMHMRGTPQTMYQFAEYKDVVKEVIFELAQKVRILQEMGVNDIIVDPGFGFAKTVDQNFNLLNHLDTFKFFELPILAGLSRKSMIYKHLSGTPETALNGTTVLNTIALQKGANILRVHDVKEAVEVISIVNKINEF